MVLSMNKAELLKKGLEKNLSHEELKELMQLAKEIDPESLVEILINLTKDVSEEKLTEILKLIPVEQQYIVSLLTSLMDDSEYAEKIDELIENIKYELLTEARIMYQEDISLDKTSYKENLKKYTEEELNYLLTEVKEDKKSEFSATTKLIIKSILNQEKKIK